MKKYISALAGMLSALFFVSAPVFANPADTVSSVSEAVPTYWTSQVYDSATTSYAYATGVEVGPLLFFPNVSRIAGQVSQLVGIQAYARSTCLSTLTLTLFDTLPTVSAFADKKASPQIASTDFSYLAGQYTLPAGVAVLGLGTYWSEPMTSLYQLYQPNLSNGLYGVVTLGGMCTFSYVNDLRITLEIEQG